MSTKRNRNKAAGFTLLEFMVVMAVFLIIGGAAVALVARHMPVFTRQQNQAALNITLRNAISQMQIDVVNAGSGYYPGVNLPSWPVGVVIKNSTPGASCFDAATFTYKASCFDSLYVVSTEPGSPPAQVSPSGATCSSVTSSSIFITPANATTTTAQLAANFHTGDLVMLVSGNTGGPTLMATAVLSQDGAVSGGKVRLQHNPTADDPLGLMQLLSAAATANPANNKLGSQFCTGDWLLKLSPVTYAVDTTDPARPKLTRQMGLNGVPVAIADDIIGFKVGAMTYDGTDDLPTYKFDPSQYPTANDPSTIRAIQVSLIGRTPPEPTSRFRNSFDNGPYRVQAMSVVINPRNLSMRDQ